MNQHMLAALANEHTAELRGLATAGRRANHDRAARPSLRVRTGWTLVDVGLRLAAQPGPGRTGQPRTAG
jgi:hypothetical protein